MAAARLSWTGREKRDRAARFELALSELLDEYGVEVGEDEWMLVCYLLERGKWSLANTNFERTLAQLKKGMHRKDKGKAKAERNKEEGTKGQGNQCEAEG
jgi:hypothetical protein